ncbi:hypothetical protein AOL_s00117g74 [Orbilia oligospora ATCC 24927]|uniref:Uncharacterized protein n=1 Tax=Arthrobotrys oligospora (strain ATCC 24927 / CBS 115.81 / DSM 1491) TaxID=756982 RepID=G1XM27_ARTOA|nr:hypothetical protein AOL_s00117g74 [Orbilia oligospora ATCC 24927]EGX45869.1 hypothetical protein AOL_s00117g74 [Orbilia oligospora ATCC 24927]
MNSQSQNLFKLCLESETLQAMKMYPRGAQAVVGDIITLVKEHLGDGNYQVYPFPESLEEPLCQYEARTSRFVVFTVHRVEDIDQDLRVGLNSVIDDTIAHENWGKLAILLE